MFFCSLWGERNTSPALCTTGHLLSMCDCHKAFGDALHVERVQFPASANNCILALCVRWCVKRHACLLAFSVFGVAYILLPGESQPTHHGITKQDILSVPWFTCPPWLFLDKDVPVHRGNSLVFKAHTAPQSHLSSGGKTSPKKQCWQTQKRLRSLQRETEKTAVLIYRCTVLLISC